MDTQKLIATLKQYPIAVICGVLSLVMLVAIFLRGAALDEVRTSYQEVSEAVTVIDSNKANASNLPQDDEKMKTLAENITSRLMKSKEAQNEHFLYFATLAVASDVNLMNPAQREFYIAGVKNSSIHTTELSQLEYELEVAGEFNKVMDFMYRLTTGDYFIRLQQMNMNPDLNEGGRMVVARMNVRCLAVTPEVKKEKKDKKGGK